MAQTSVGEEVAGILKRSCASYATYPDENISGCAHIDGDTFQYPLHAHFPAAYPGENVSVVHILGLPINTPCVPTFLPASAQYNPFHINHKPVVDLQLPRLGAIPTTISSATPPTNSRETRLLRTFDRTDGSIQLL